MRERIGSVRGLVGRRRGTNAFSRGREFNGGAQSIGAAVPAILKYRSCSGTSSVWLTVGGERFGRGPVHWHKLCGLGDRQNIGNSGIARLMGGFQVSKFPTR